MSECSSSGGSDMSYSEWVPVVLLVVAYAIGSRWLAAKMGVPT